MTTLKSLSKTVTLRTATQNFQWGAGDQWVLFAGPDIFEDEAMVLAVGGCFTEYIVDLRRVTA